MLTGLSAASRPWVALVLLLSVTAVGCRRSSPAVQTPQGTITVYFSPQGGCTEAVVDAIEHAQRTLDIQAYSFTSAPIAQAVAQAHARGVRVRAVLDKSQRTQRYTSATYLHNHQVPTFIDDQHAIAHNKVMIIDGATVLTGSFNFTKAAEQNNAENLLVIRDNPQLAALYEENFEKHLAHSTPYTGPQRAGTGAPAEDQ